MNSKTISKRFNMNRIVAFIAVCVILVAASTSIGYMLGAKQDTSEGPMPEPQQSGYAANPAYEYMVGASAWQMSAEAHALMMQGFYLAEKNVDEMVSLAESGLDGYRFVEDGGEKKLYLGDKRVCVVCDIDDT